MQDLHSGTITRAYCRAIYEESVSRCFILPPLAGEVRRSRIGGGERSEPVSRMIIIPYDTESKSRNADFIIRGEAATTTLGAEGPVKLKNPWAEGPSILRTFPSEPSEPSHRRCVQRRRATSPRTSRLL